jgi:hypothetical protein
MVVVRAGRCARTRSSRYTPLSFNVDVLQIESIHLIVEGCVEARSTALVIINFVADWTTRIETPWYIVWLLADGTPTAAFGLTLLLIDAKIATIVFLSVT